MGLKNGGKSVVTLYPVILDSVGVPFLDEFLYTKLKLELPGKEGVFVNVDNFIPSMFGGFSMIFPGCNTKSFLFFSVSCFLALNSFFEKNVDFEEQPPLNDLSLISQTSLLSLCDHFLLPQKVLLEEEVF